MEVAQICPWDSQVSEKNSSLEEDGNSTIFRLRHMKNKDVRQWHALSQNSEAIDV